jgi:hypothetical protein
MKRTFKVALSEDASFEVPFDVRATYGEARPAVKMTVLGETFRTRVAVYGGKYFLGLWKAVREKHGLRAGQMMNVSIEPDRAPRAIDTPKELEAAMKDNAAVRAGWDALSFTHKRQWATAIQGAKKEETRARRVAKAIETLVARGKKASSKAPKPRRERTAK